MKWFTNIDMHIQSHHDSVEQQNEGHKHPTLLCYIGTSRRGSDTYFSSRLAH